MVSNNEIVVAQSIFKIGSVLSVNGREVKIKVDKQKNLPHTIYNGSLIKNVSVGGYVKIINGFSVFIAKVEGVHVDNVYYEFNGTISEPGTVAPGSGTLYLLNEDEHKNPVKMAEIIINNNVNFSVTTPTKIELLLSNPNTKKCLSVLDTIQLGGEVFTSSLYEKLRAVTNANISNGYGPTEITACCSSKNILSAENINIGKPIPNMKIYILDKDGNLCPIGVPGELCISGIGLAQGYINDDEKTQKAFVTSKIKRD